MGNHKPYISDSQLCLGCFFKAVTSNTFSLQLKAINHVNCYVASEFAISYCCLNQNYS